MRRPWTHAVLLLPLVAACGGGAAGKPAEVPSPRAATAASISAADLRNRISIFAADSMQGRRTGTPGNVRGNAYIASELKRLGLRPAGDSGTFLQRLPLTSYAIDPDQATLRAGPNALAAFKDYYPYQPTFEVPAARSRGRSCSTSGGIADTAKLPSRRRAAREARGLPQRQYGEHVARCARPLTRRTAGADLGYRDHPDRSAHRHLRAAVPLAPRDLPSGLNVPPGITQPRMIFLPTASVPKLFGKSLERSSRARPVRPSRAMCASSRR